MPGLLKVGHTLNDPRKRASELFTTGVPTPFTVEFVMIAYDAASVEKDFHDTFEDYRTPRREFFKMEVDTAIAGLFRMSHDAMVVRYEDEVTDEGDHIRYSRMAGVNPFSLMQLLDHLSEQEWRILAERNNDRLQKRKEARNGG